MTLKNFLIQFHLQNPFAKPLCYNMLRRCRETRTSNELITEGNNDMWLAHELPLYVNEVHQFAHQQKLNS